MNPDHTGQCNISLVTWTLGRVGPLRHANGHARQEPRSARGLPFQCFSERSPMTFLLVTRKDTFPSFSQPTSWLYVTPWTLIFSNSPPSPSLSPRSLVLSLAPSFYSTGLRNLEFEKVCVPLILPDSLHRQLQQHPVWWLQLLYSRQ